MDPGDKLIKRPVYPGGRKALSDFIYKHLKYPSEALENKIEGLVITYIDIDHKGKVVKVRLKKKLGYGCDEEAIRVVKLLNFFVVNKRKMRLTHHKTIKVHFKLPPPPKEKKVAKTQANIPSKGLEIVYTYVPSKKK